jgi:hypothetical protein
MRIETSSEEQKPSAESRLGPVREKRPSKLPVATLEEIKKALAKGRLVDQDMIPVQQSHNEKRNGH